MVLRAVSMQLVSVNGTSDLWQDMSPWFPTIGVFGVRGVLVLAEKSGNFRVHIGIQTATTDREIANSPLNPTVGGTGLGYVATQGKNLYDFDPTNASNGNIAASAYFRIGLLYSSTDATIGRGNVVLHVGLRRDV